VWSSRSQLRSSFPHFRIERAEGLVEQQHGRFDGERAGKRHPLPLAARNLARKARLKSLQLHKLEQAAHAARDLARAGPLVARTNAQPEGDIVEDGHMTEKRILLEDEADAALAQAERGRVFAVEADGAFLRRGETGDGAEQRRLAGAGGPEQRQQFAGADGERDIVQRRKVAVALAQFLDIDANRRAARARFVPVVPRISGARSRQVHHRTAIRGAT